MVNEKDSRLSLRLDARLRAALEKAADEDHRNLSSLVEKILSDWARNAGYLKK